MKKIENQTRRVSSCFNRVIELNQKMLILKRFVTKNVLYVMMTTEMFINYFCNIKLCCLWKFDDNMSVIYWEIICANILFYIYCFRVKHLNTRQHGMATIVCERLMTICLLFTEKLSVLIYCFIFIVLGWDTSTHGNIKWPQRCDRGVTGGRSLTLRSG
jgi:hypothetical protein